MFCSRDEQQHNNQTEMHSFTSHMLLVYWQYSLFPLTFYMVQQSRGFGSSATDSVESFTFSELHFSPCTTNGHDIFLGFVKAFIALKGDL